MLIRNDFTSNSTSILENATYLYESEMPNVSAYSIPVVANDRFNAGIVSYEDINRLCENTGITTQYAIKCISEANNIDPNDIVVSIDESTIISDPWVVDEVHQYVVSPVSENNIAYKYTDMMVDMFLESGDNFYLEAIGEPELVLEADDNKDEIDRYGYDRNDLDLDYNSKKNVWKDDEQYKKGGVVSSILYKPGTNAPEMSRSEREVLNPNFLVKIKRFLTDKPRDFLAKTAARLRQTYRKFLVKANKENDENKIKWYKQIARKVLQAVDWILKKIEGLKVNYKKRYDEGLKDLKDRMGKVKDLEGFEVSHGGNSTHYTKYNGEFRPSTVTGYYLHNTKETYKLNDKTGKLEKQ